MNGWPATSVVGGVVTTSCVAGEAATTMASEIAPVRLPAVKLSVRGPAVFSMRPGNVATPRTGSRSRFPGAGRRRWRRRDRDGRAAVAGLDVAVGVLLGDHRLRRECLARRRRAEGCVWTTSLAATAGMTVMLVGSLTVNLPPEKPSVIVSALSSARPVKVATPFESVACRPDERAGAGRGLRGNHRAAVAGLEVAEPVLLLDHGLDAQHLAGRRGPRATGQFSTINWLAAAAQTLMLPEGARLEPAAGEIERDRFFHIVVEADEGRDAARDGRPSSSSPVAAARCGLASETVTGVLLSPVSTLPYSSCSAMTGCVANAAPAEAEAEGCVWMGIPAGRRRADDDRIAGHTGQARGVEHEHHGACLLQVERSVNVATPSATVTVVPSAGRPGRSASP